MLRPDNYQPYQAVSSDKLIATGKQLFADTSLSSNGMSCQSCHQGNAMFKQTFTQPYPHQVSMPENQAGIQSIHLDEMVQFCLSAAMKAEPLPWDSQELAALTAYTRTLQQQFIENNQ